MDASLGCHLSGRSDPAGPAFFRRVSIAGEDELFILAFTWQQHQRGIWIAHAGQIQKVVFLPKRPVDITRPTDWLGRERDEYTVRADRLCD